MVRFSRPLHHGADIELDRGTDGGLTVRVGGELHRARVRPCFPWSDPGRFLSLRDDEDREVALVGSLHDLAPGSRRVLEEALVEAGFVLQVTAILDVDEEVEIRRWRVRTRQGPRSFQTRLDDWPREVPGGGLVIRDVAGDLYHVPDPDGMDEGSRRRLWAFVD